MRNLALLVMTLLTLSSCDNYYHGEKSDHFDGKRFFDPTNNNDKSLFEILKWKFTRNPAKWPKNVAVESYDAPPERIIGDEIRVSNVGHASFLIQTAGINILTDPVWSERASPLTFAGPKRIIAPGIKFEDLPPIDVVWISHNHYDHLDIATIKKLWNKYKPRIITPLGNDTIIQSNYPDIEVKALDWGEKIQLFENITFHCTPMQHWSARGLFDRNKALWGALTIETNGGNIYFVGDSGYGNGRYFKSDKLKFKDYRLAILPIGAYKPRWFMKYGHMNPGEMVKAHDDLGKPYTIPSHYDVFQMTDEEWGAPSTALKEAIEENGGREKIKQLGVGEFYDVP